MFEKLEMIPVDTEMEQHVKTLAGFGIIAEPRPLSIYAKISEYASDRPWMPQRVHRVYEAVSTYIY